MSQDPASRENPLRAPSILIEAVDSTIPDQLEVVVRYIDQLPPSFRKAISEDLQYIEAAQLEDLREFLSGLQKVRKGVLPTRNELGVIARPHDMLRDLAEGFREAALSEDIPLDTERFIDGQVADQLDLIAKSYLPDAADSLVAEWAQNLSKTHYGHSADDLSQPAP